MATFVLVHGAWHGGWCWQRVAPLLRAAGHEVYTPTLTGLGERAHLGSAETTLDTHITDVVNVLAYEELTGAILVGHSYAGVVVSGVAQRVPERLAHLVYLDAFLPRDGQAMLDLIPSAAAASVRERAATEGAGWRIPPQPAAWYGITDPADAGWVEAKLVAQPLGTFAQAVRLDGTAPVAATYVLCTQPPGFARTAEQVRHAPGWRYRELATGHDAMITMPRETADLLLDVAASAAGSG